MTKPPVKVGIQNITTRSGAVETSTRSENAWVKRLCFWKLFVVWGEWDPWKLPYLFGVDASLKPKKKNR